MIKNILSIAGSDPSGGAGVQADLKTFSALGAYGMAAPTALTVQNTRGVSGVHTVPARFVTDQVQAIFDDIRVDAVKIGMVGCAETVAALAGVLAQRKPGIVILDPVMAAQSGDTLSDTQTIKAVAQYLFPVATMITPNIPEAERFLGKPFDGNMDGFAEALMLLGANSVYLKGGHLSSDPVARDLYKDGVQRFALEAPRIETKNNHGTGCTLSSALATYLAQGHEIKHACQSAKKYITETIRFSNNLDVGRGAGPVHHFWAHDAHRAVDQDHA